MSSIEETQEKAVFFTSNRNKDILDTESSRTSEYDFIDRTLMGDQRNRTLFDWAPQAIVIINTEGMLLDANLRLYEWLGYRPEEVIGKNIIELPFFTEKTRAVIKQKFFERIKGIEHPAYEAEFIDKEGKSHWGKIHGKLLRDESAGVILDLVMVSDISEQKKVIEDLKESEEKYRSIFEHANDLIQSVDATGHFIEVNPKWFGTLGYSQGELPQLTLQDVIHPDQLEHCTKIFEQVCAGEAVQHIRTVFVAKDGHEIPVEGSANAIIKNKEFVATIGIFREIEGTP